MGGGKPRASTPARAPPRHFPSVSPTPFFRPASTDRNPHEPPTFPNRAMIPRRTKVRSMPTSPRANQPRASDATIHTGSPPNNPEQIRTDPNTAEHPDQIEPAHGPPPNIPEQIRTDLNTAERPDQIEPAHGPPPNIPEQIRTDLNTAERPDQIGPPSGSPPNNPEQIRTDPNTAEHPDQIGPAHGAPPNTQKKTNLNTVAVRSRQPTLPPAGRGELDRNGRVCGMTERDLTA